MPYVRRNLSGLIDSLHRQPQGGGEFLADDHPEVQAFVGNSGAPAHGGNREFDRLDADFVRVLEDVIDTLIVKNVLNLSLIHISEPTRPY